ncbi:MAG: hypothetical protein ACLP8Y_03205 [Thermoplasmata archaeon]
MARETNPPAEVHEFMTIGQRLLAVLLALAMMFACSATLWVVAPH